MILDFSSDLSFTLEHLILVQFVPLIKASCICLRGAPIFSYGQFLPLTLPLSSKVVKIDSKIIISLPKSKSL
jgi:hypothetical protein